MKKMLISFILGGIVFTLGGVVATTAISSTNVTYQKKTVNTALDELYNQAVTGKELVADAITNKGITTTASDTYETMATNINNIDIDHTEIIGKISNLESKHNSEVSSLTGSISSINQSLSNKVDVENFTIIADDLNEFFKKLGDKISNSLTKGKHLIGGAWYNHYYMSGHCFVSENGFIYVVIYLGGNRLYTMDYRVNNYRNVYVSNMQLVTF